MEIKLCKCGCGKGVRKPHHDYAWGHNPKTGAAAKPKAAKGIVVVKPVPQVREQRVATYLSVVALDAILTSLSMETKARLLSYLPLPEVAS